ncbi:MAG TPA: hypothetical protein VNH64_02480 [Parvularculaceae bacterium]|nr:hypothetical protein [Parvularculaceae bacterium]
MMRGRGQVLHTLCLVLSDGEEVALRVSTYVRGTKPFFDFVLAAAALLRASAQTNPALIVWQGFPPRYRRQGVIIAVGIGLGATGYIVATSRTAPIGLHVAAGAFAFVIFLAILFNMFCVSRGPGESPNALAARLEERAARGKR